MNVHAWRRHLNHLWPSSPHRDVNVNNNRA